MVKGIRRTLTGPVLGIWGGCLFFAVALGFLAGCREPAVDPVAAVFPPPFRGNFTRPSSAIQLTISVASSGVSPRFRAFVSLCTASTEYVFTFGTTAAPVAFKWPYEEEPPVTVPVYILVSCEVPQHRRRQWGMSLLPGPRYRHPDAGAWGPSVLVGNPFYRTAHFCPEGRDFGVCLGPRRANYLMFVACDQCGRAFWERGLGTRVGSRECKGGIQSNNIRN